MNEYEIGTSIICDATFRDQDGVLYNPTTVTAFVELPSGTIATIPAITHGSVGYYYFSYTLIEEGEHTYQFTGTTGAVVTVESSFFIAVYYTHTDLDYLIPDLRFHLGDISERKYNTDFLRQALIMGIKTLMKKWRFRYYYSNGTITRNSGITYEIVSPPVLQVSDERAIILQASIIVKSADIQDTAWDIGSWRDDEIAYSNIAGAGTLKDSLENDKKELELWLRTKLFGTAKQSLQGFRNPPNIFEGYRV